MERELQPSGASSQLLSQLPPEASWLLTDFSWEPAAMVCSLATRVPFAFF